MQGKLQIDSIRALIVWPLKSRILNLVRQIIGAFPEGCVSPKYAYFIQITDCSQT